LFDIDPDLSFLGLDLELAEQVVGSAGEGGCGAVRLVFDEQARGRKAASFAPMTPTAHSATPLRPNRGCWRTPDESTAGTAAFMSSGPPAASSRALLEQNNQ
jgi:hypothetical protein